VSDLFFRSRRMVVVILLGFRKCLGVGCLKLFCVLVCFLGVICLKCLCMNFVVV